MKILVVGRNSQLGLTFKDVLNGDNVIFAPSVRETGTSAVCEFVEKSDADTVVNCAAWTDVRGAEIDSNHYDVFELNTLFPANLAMICKETGKRFIHFSTDYVFKGGKPIPYTESDMCAPLNIYGYYKLQGERYTSSINPDVLIIRTAGLYSPYGKNFIKMVYEKLQEEQQILVVRGDLTTSITDAESLAKITLRAIESELKGVFHFSNSPPLTWNNVATKVAELAGYPWNISLPWELTKTVATDNVNRPFNSALDSSLLLHCTGFQPEHWETCLANVIEEIKKAR